MENLLNATENAVERFIRHYYLAPIAEHTGYNIVNTLTYAAIAILGVYIIHKMLKGRIRFDSEFLASVLSFTLFAATARVVTDSIDTGVFKPVTVIHQLVLDSHIYDYGITTTSPGIYIVTFALFLGTLAVLYRLQKLKLHKYIGIALWLPHFLLLVPLMGYIVYAIPVILLAVIPSAAAYWHFRKLSFACIVAGHSLDGAATFFAIDYFSAITGIRYFEQHVVSGAIGLGSGSYFTFFLVKVAVSFAAAYLLLKEAMHEEDKNFLAAGIMVMGFGPGIRDVLRMITGA